MVGMIQDFIANEFGQFNAISNTIVSNLFNSNWQGFMAAVYGLSSVKVMGVLVLLTVIIIVFNKKNIWLELSVYAITVIGTFLFSSMMHWLFRFLFNNKPISSDFPDQPAMFLLCIFVFFLMMMLRHRRNYLIIPILLVFFVFILAAYSISAIYIKHLNPSDIMAGYVFGGAWVSGMLLALEMFRFLSHLKRVLKP